MTKLTREERSRRMSELQTKRYANLPKCSVCISEGREKPQIAVKGTNPPVCYGTHGGREWKQSQPGYQRPKGRRSASLPRYLVRDYEEGLIDPRLLSLREDIATTEARIKDLMRKISKNPKDSLEFAKALQSLLAKGARRIKDKMITATLLLGEVEDLCKSKIDVSKVWGEIDRLTELKARLVKEEVAMMVKLQLIMTPEALLRHLQVMALEAKGWLKGKELEGYREALVTAFKGNGANTLQLSDGALSEVVAVETVRTDGVYEPVNGESLKEKEVQD